MMTANPTPGEPAELDALVALAHREHRAGRLAEAVAAYREVLARRPDIAEMHNNLGNVLADQGKLDEAAAQYERAVALKPSLFQTHNSLGNLLWKQGKLDQAVARLKQALALEPNLPGARNNLGCILRSQGKVEEAAAQFERALALKPDLAEAHNNLGNILWHQGKLDHALTRYERALALAPDYAEAHNNLGNALMELGKFDEAMAHYDQAIGLKPDYAEAHYHRTDLKTFHAGDPDLAALEALVTENRLPPGKMLYVHFALGKALEDIGEYPGAFEHLLQANALKRRELPYDEPGYQRAFRTIAERFDEAFLEQFAGMGDPSATPIFIVGMPRSGSTLVEQILASHPLVHAAGELKNLDRVVETLSDPDGRPIPYLSNHRNLDADGLRRLGHNYLVGLPTPAAGTTRITDKAPSNFFHIGLIRLMLPNARIIHTLRDPVDTCVSCFARLFAQGQSFSYDLAQLGGYYRWYHELMEHWRSVLPADVLLDVAYEDLVDNFEPQARRLIDFCGLPWDDRCLSFHQIGRPVRTASSVQVRRPLYRSSLARWRRYEAYLQPLLAELEDCRQ